MISKDLLEFYNALISADINVPIGVTYSMQNRCLVFSQYSWRMDSSILNYYCSNLTEIKNTVLLPEDTKELLDTLKSLLTSGQLTGDRVLVSPTKYGMDIYKTNIMNTSLGPIKLGSIKLVSSNNWLFRQLVKFKFKNIIGDIKR